MKNVLLIWIIDGSNAFDSLLATVVEVIECAIASACKCVAFTQPLFVYQDNSYLDEFIESIAEWKRDYDKVVIFLPLDRLTKGWHKKECQKVLDIACEKMDTSEIILAPIFNNDVAEIKEAEIQFIATLISKHKFSAVASIIDEQYFRDATIFNQTPAMVASGGNILWQQIISAINL